MTTALELYSGQVPVNMPGLQTPCYQPMHIRAPGTGKSGAVSDNHRTHVSDRESCSQPDCWAGDVWASQPALSFERQWLRLFRCHLVPQQHGQTHCECVQGCVYTHSMCVRCISVHVWNRNEGLMEEGVEETFNPDTSHEDSRHWLPPLSQAGVRELAAATTNPSKNLLPRQLSSLTPCLAL